MKKFLDYLSGSVVLLAGWVLLWWGLWVAYAPLAPITLGVFLVVLAFLKEFRG